MTYQSQSERNRCTRTITILWTTSNHMTLWMVFHTGRQHGLSWWNGILRLRCDVLTHGVMWSSRSLPSILYRIAVSGLILRMSATCVGRNISLPDIQTLINIYGRWPHILFIMSQDIAFKVLFVHFRLYFMGQPYDPNLWLLLTTGLAAMLVPPWTSGVTVSNRIEVIKLE